MNISVQFNVAVAFSRGPPLQFVNTRPAGRSSKSQEEEREGRAGVSDGDPQTSQYPDDGGACSGWWRKVR